MTPETTQVTAAARTKIRTIPELSGGIVLESDGHQTVTMKRFAAKNSL